jgi:hypothetical protein
MEFPDDFYSNPEHFFAALGPNLPQPSSFPTAADVRREARSYSSVIFARWNALHDILDRHEELIGRRWLKKTHSQRITILQSAWPGMSKDHRPDFVALQKETVQMRRHGSQYRDAYLWPYINVEDLVQSKHLLLFLNSRGRHPPETFALADYEAAHLGLVSQAVERSFLNGYTMLLYGQTKAEDYGKVVAWDDDDRAFDWMMSEVGRQPGEGLLILEIQQKILDFLVKCCELILHDLPPNSLRGPATAAAPIQGEPSHLASDPTVCASLASMVAESPYRIPGRLDLTRLHAIITAKRSAAKDHIWALREDPGYFADTVREESDHRQETILSINGKSHPILKTPTFWNRILNSVIVEAYGSFVIWDELHKQLSHLEALAQLYPGPFVWDSKLPKDYSDQLHRFKYCLQQATKGPILSLKHGVPASPPLRSRFVREPQEKNSTMIRVKTKCGIGDNRILWIFQLLWDDTQLFLYGLSNLMDEFDRVMNKDATQKQLISPWVANRISDLSILAESLRQLSFFQPWANASEHEALDMEADLRANFEESMSDLAKVVAATTNLSVADLGNPSSRFFYYPADKRPTRQTVEDMRQAETRLDAFWKKVDEHFNSHFEGWNLWQALPKYHQLYRTPAWVEVVEESRIESQTNDQDSLSEPFGTMQLNAGQATSGPASVAGIVPSKTKTKTRGVAHSEPPDLEPGPSEDPQPDTRSKFVVGKCAYKVFSMLFFTPSQSDQAGEIPWNDFLRAMRSTGFEPEKLYGSVWQFTPTKLDVERSIQFHAPHPNNKIPFWLARRFGRRLNRAYGWTSDLFVRE